MSIFRKSKVENTSEKEIELIWKVVKGLRSSEPPKKKNKLAILFKDVFGFGLIFVILFVIYSFANKDNLPNLQAKQPSHITKIDILEAKQPSQISDTFEIKTVITPAETTDNIIYLPDTSKVIITEDNYQVRIYANQ